MYRFPGGPYHILGPGKHHICARQMMDQVGFSGLGDTAQASFEFLDVLLEVTLQPRQEILRR